MERVNSMRMLAVFALVLLVSSVNGRILTKCELKAQLDAVQFQVPDNMILENLIASLVCRANGSAFNTKFVKFVTDNLQSSPPPGPQGAPQSPPPPGLQGSHQDQPPSGPQDPPHGPPSTGQQGPPQGSPLSGPQGSHQDQPPSGPQDPPHGPPSTGQQGPPQYPPPPEPQGSHQDQPPSGPQVPPHGPPSTGLQGTPQSPPPPEPQGSHQDQPPSGPQDPPHGPPSTGQQGRPQGLPQPGPKRLPKGPLKPKRFARQERDLPAVWHQFGLFQLSDTVACDSAVLPSLNICKMNCSALIDDDIMDDIFCLKTLMQEMKLVEQVNNSPGPITMEDLLGKECEHVDASKFFAECV